MSKQAFIFEVSQQSFDQYVLLNSHKIPVVALFLGVWSEPCIFLSDMFSSLAKEFPEEFIFAKIDIDEQTELREKYEIKNVPTIIVFKDGKVARNEVGQLTEAEARNLLKDFGVFRESDAIREEARNSHLSGNTTNAIMLLTQAIQKDPGNIRIAMDMVQIFLDIRELEQAEQLFNKFPEKIKQTDTGQSLAVQITFIKQALKTAGKAALLDTLANEPDNHDARFDLSICMLADFEYAEAADELFTILQQQADYKDGAAREMIATISNMLSKNQPELSQKIRRKLSNLLSS